MDTEATLDDSTFMALFLDQTLPWKLWNHRAHLKVAYLHLTHYPFAEAVERVRRGIQAYNAAHNVPDGPHMGYHETVTQAWMRLVHMTMQVQGTAETADAFCDAQPQLGQKKALRFFYSPERIMSPEAKHSFVEPDLTPLPSPVEP